MESIKIYKKSIKTLTSILFFIIVIHTQAQQFTDVTVSAGLSSPNGMGFNVVWIDYNNDGLLDIFGSSDISFFYCNNGDGTFTDVTNSTGLSDIIPNSIAVADYDKDGFQDLLIASNFYSTPVIVYKNVNGQYFEPVDSLVNYAEEALWLDYNGDGLLDIFVNKLSNVVLYKNKGNNIFQDVTESMGLTNTKGVAASATDFNNDGFTDIYICSSSRNSFFKNQGAGFYQDITNTAGVGNFGNTVAVTWGDYNNDGYMDLYFANIQSNHNLLFKNNGDETFTNFTYSAGVPDVGDARSCSFIDYNNDTWLDLFNTNHISPNKLYKNNKDGTFTDVASESNISDPEDGFGISWGDYDKDGDLDVLICGHNSLTLNLLRNDGGDLKNYIFLNLHGVYDNASGIGTRINLFTDGNCQIRDLCGVTGNNGQNALPAHFGLDTASIVDSIILRWQSGMIQKLYNITANQYLDITQQGNVPPVVFHLLTPQTDTLIPNKVIDFKWSSSIDPDNNNPIEYNLVMNSVNNDTIITGITDTTISLDLSNWAVSDSIIQWYVIATDEETFRNSWENWQFIYSPETDIYPQNKMLYTSKLYDNYPNPFNSKTKIKYYISRDGKVELKIYNITGELIITLVNEMKKSGHYEVIWNCKDKNNESVSSGIYFYILQTDNYYEMKKCIMIN